MGKTLDLGPMPWETHKWLDSTTRHSMNTSQRSIYRDMLDKQWNDGVIPEERAALTSLAAVPSEEFAASWPTVRRCFVKVRGGLLNRKLDELRRKRIADLEKVSEQRRNAVSVRWQKERADDTARIQPVYERSFEGGVSLSLSGFSEDFKPPEKPPENNQARSVSGSVPVFRSNGYDPRLGWEKFRARFPQIRKPQLACQAFLSACTSAEIETEILAGVESYKLSGEVARGVLTSAENWLRDRMWEGKFAGAKREETEREKLARL